MATPTMADTKASNGELTLRMPVDSKTSIRNIGTGIWNPLTGKLIGRGHYSKMKREGIDLCQLERNNWIDEFHGTLTDEEFLNQPHIQMLTQDKRTPLVEPITELEQKIKNTLFDQNLESTIVTQASQMDELTKELNAERLTSQQLRHEFEKMRESSHHLSRMADKLVRSCDRILGLDDQTF